MMVIASRSSTTARVSRNIRSADGRWVLITASTASAKAMSVAVGIAHPVRPAPPPAVVTATKISAGTAIPPTAAATGSAARRGSRRSPATNSRLSSSPATKKKIASSPSAAQAARGRSRCSAAGPTRSAERRRTRRATASSPTAAPARPRRPAAARRWSRCAAGRRCGGPPATSHGRTGGGATGGEACIRMSSSGVGCSIADQTSRHTCHDVSRSAASRLGGDSAAQGVEQPLETRAVVVHHGARRLSGDQRGARSPPARWRSRRRRRRRATSRRPRRSGRVRAPRRGSAARSAAISRARATSAGDAATVRKKGTDRSLTPDSGWPGVDEAEGQRRAGTPARRRPERGRAPPSAGARRRRPRGRGRGPPCAGSG